MYNFSYRFALPPPEANTLYLKNSYYELRVHWDSLASFQKSSLAQLAVNVRQSHIFDIFLLLKIVQKTFRIRQVTFFALELGSSIV
jgi:hypothetical protein